MFEAGIVKVSHKVFQTKKEVITYLTTLAAGAGKIGDEKSYIDSVMEREGMASTAVGFGIAIPHGESDAVTEIFVACLNLENPIQWDNEMVNLVFMIGVPLASRNKDHLRILAMLSRHLMKEEFRNELRSATTDQAFYDSIQCLENEK